MPQTFRHPPPGDICPFTPGLRRRDIRQTVIGTRFTTGCVHSWKRRHPRWTVEDLRDACADCAVCGEYLLIPREQFDAQTATTVPAAVHAPLFHRYLALTSGGAWPADGLGTFSTAFDVD